MELSLEQIEKVSRSREPLAEDVAKTQVTSGGWKNFPSKGAIMSGLSTSLSDAMKGPFGLVLIDNGSGLNVCPLRT